MKTQSTFFVRELTAQYKPLKKAYKTFLNSPELVSEFLMEKIGSEAKENFVVIGLNNKNMIVIYSVISQGTVSESIVHPREVFTAAILGNCSSIIVAHNHPSGIVDPSKQDIAITKRLNECGEILSIPLTDHVIVGFNTLDHYSFKENGYIE